MGRVSKERAGENRRAVIAAASGLLRQKGLNGVGVRELMAAAGLTQGAFAGQFGTKEALAAEACALAFQGAEKALSAASEGERKDQARRLVEYYLRPRPSELDCPMSTLAVDVARERVGSEVRRAFTEGFGRLARLVAGEPYSPDRLVLLAAMVGASILCRASDDSDLASKIEAAVQTFGQGVE